MATVQPIPITHEDVEEVEALLRELKNRAQEASDKNHVIMLGLYAELVKRVSPEVQRLRARLDRDEKATINKQHREQRKALRASAANSA
mgnify:CR=1 FL=1